MFNKLYYCASCFLFCLSAIAQTGPAGVGSSTNNVLWLKADVGTSSTSNNTAISFWNDASGNSINVTQTVSAQQPSFATNVINGFPAIQFDNVNGANLNDKLLSPDSPLLDNTSGYSFFMVSRPQNVDGNARVIVSKRTSVSVDQSFMHFFFTGNRFYTDIQTTNDRYNTVATFSSNNNYLVDQFYDGTLASGSRCRTYISGSLNVTSSESSTLVTDNASPLIVGSTDASDPRPFGGYIAETIIYRVALNDASRIIVDNYLSAKYNISLSVNDKYAGDNSGNGDYDREVAGIGQESSGSSTSFSASVSGGLSLSATAGLDNGDYILTGHALATNTTITTDVGGMTGVNNARWERIWYFDITNSSTNITTNLEFDMSDGGMGTFTLGVVSNYVLLYRAGQSGNWTELSTASSVSGDRILFNGITLTNDGYYTLGTQNINSSPLPIELISFSAKENLSRVDIFWSTASERNNALFEVERSKNGSEFELVEKLAGAGNTSITKYYQTQDKNPYSGISYYRLKQIDLNGENSYSKIVSVDFENKTNKFTVYPNPTNGLVFIETGSVKFETIQVTLTDAAGRICFAETLEPEKHGRYILNLEKLPASGKYTLTIFGEGYVETQNLILH